MATTASNSLPLPTALEPAAIILFHHYASFRFLFARVHYRRLAVSRLEGAIFFMLPFGSDPSFFLRNRRGCSYTHPGRAFPRTHASAGGHVDRCTIYGF